ncbi:uncharacterized protein slc44a1b isoform X7 [Phyllopteryx taeniolatus]|uniref:uncharacterized protein slc44a1b isoform X7 n=1 Tax=Phyllopteryx taeniolatus TaxID=161469 RepID=UPI002AD51F3E|nr:uncharacterized protein slc44a1b isoform X7 [Phyllopteryx taeniolatus]
MYHQDLPRPSRTFQVSPGQSVNMESRRPEQQLHFRLKRTKREWRPLEERSCTDLPWFLLFIIFCVGMGSVCAFTVVSGGAARLVLGYDSYGNTCGRRNRHLDGVRLSGLDHTDRKFVFFLDPCNIDIVQRKMKSVALCVSLCPPHTLHTYHDLKTFAVLNGSELCSYELAGHKYPSLPERFSKCPKLPVPPSKPLPLFNRCTPVDISCYSKFAEAVVTFVSDDSFLHRVIAGVAASKEVIVGLCLLALGDPAAADAVHEEARGIGHRSLSRGRKGFHPFAAAHAAAVHHLPRAAPLLDLLDPRPALPGNQRGGGAQRGGGPDRVPSDRSPGVPDLVPRRGPAVDHGVHPGLPADDGGRRRGHLLLHQGQEATSGLADSARCVAAAAVSRGHGGQRLLHHHAGQDAQTPPHLRAQAAQREGERVRSLRAQVLHLLSVVFREVPQLSQPERLRGHGHQQHGLLHVRARRLRPAGGERPACGYRQRHRRFRALPREDSDRDHDGFRRRSAAQRAARLRRVAAAAGHRLSVRLLGGTLFPVRLRDGGGRALPLLRHRHQVQRRHAGKGVLHGQSSHGAGRAQPAFGAGGRPGADPRQGSAVGGGGDETHGEWRSWGRRQRVCGVGGAGGVPGVLPPGGSLPGLRAHAARRLPVVPQPRHLPLPVRLPANLHPLPVRTPAGLHPKLRPFHTAWLSSLSRAAGTLALADGRAERTC